MVAGVSRLVSMVWYACTTVAGMVGGLRVPLLERRILLHRKVVLWKARNPICCLVGCRCRLLAELGQCFEDGVFLSELTKMVWLDNGSAGESG